MLLGVSQYPSHLRSQEEETQGDWSCSGQSGVEKKLRASEGDIGHGSVFGIWDTVGSLPTEELVKSAKPFVGSALTKHLLGYRAVELELDGE